MTSNTQRIDEQAAEWAVRLHPGPLAPEDQQALDQWLAADARHPGALLYARTIWQDLDRIGALAAGKTAESPASGVASLGPKSKSRSDRKRWLRSAAGIAALALTVSAWWAHHERPVVYVSDIGEVRRVRLADGSNMVLNTATKATVRIDPTRRDIQLEEGEGLFEVAKDPVRPFVVHAGPISIRAVGTVFSVRAINQQVDVTVTEGLVELVDNSQGRRVVRRIGANQHAAVTEVRQVAVQALAQDQAERRLAWQDGMVGFDGEPLHYAVAEMNRHNHKQIVIDDPRLAVRPVVGLFRAGDPDNFAATVAIALGAQSVERDDAIHLVAVNP